MLLRNAVALTVVGLAACAMGQAPPALEVVQAEAPRVVPSTQAEITLSFAPVVRRTAPAVVNIYTRKLVERRVSPFAGEPFFERFFKDMFPRPGVRRRMENSLGSGVILDPSGIVVSNYHVVAGADEITVILKDRREFQGRVIFADRDSDLAVVKLDDAEGLPSLSLRDSDTLEVGDLVLAIGNPFGVGQTVTSGIVSGLARTAAPRAQRPGVFIQTDAAINPGNSGGALVDMQGRLVGINTAILSRAGGSNGIGFAVPANLVAKVVSVARQGEASLVRPWLGIDGRQVDGELAMALGMPTPSGFLVEALHPTSPFAAAGVSRGDVITGLDGEPVNSIQELEFHAATKRLGVPVGIDYMRKGAALTAHLTLAAAADLPPRDERTFGSADGLPGLTVANANPAVIEEHDLPVTTEGVVVLRSQGPARRIGLRPRDLIRQFDGVPVEDVATLAARLREASGVVALAVERGGRLGRIRFRR